MDKPIHIALDITRWKCKSFKFQRLENNYSTTYRLSQKNNMCGGENMVMKVLARSNQLNKQLSLVFQLMYLFELGSPVC